MSYWVVLLFGGVAQVETKSQIAHKITFEGKEYELKHGSVVIAAITSCTNTSNPSVMLQAGIVCSKLGSSK